MPVHDNPVKGVRFECDEKGCEKTLPLDFQGRNKQQLWSRARERGWWVIDLNTCYCPEHTAARIQVGQIIEEIHLRIEVLPGILHGNLWSERKGSLKELTVPQLEQLCQNLQGIPTLSAANSAIVAAIHDSRQAGRMADAAKWDAIDPRPPR